MGGHVVYCSENTPKKMCSVDPRPDCNIAAYKKVK